MRLLTVLFLITVSTVAEKRHFDEPHQNVRIKDDKNLEEFDVDPIVNHPVPFGHIGLEGFEDPTGQLKQPFDYMELTSTFLKGGERTKQWLEKHNISYIDLRPGESKEDFNMTYPFHEDQKSSEENFTKLNDSVAFWDLAAIQQRNIYNPPSRRVSGVRPRPQDAGMPLPTKYAAVDGPNFDLKKAGMPNRPASREDLFKRGTFLLQFDEEYNNFSTCDEFGRNAKFHPNHIVNKDWVPFFIWNHEETALLVAKVHKFTYPTKKLVVKYKEELGLHINTTIDWEQTKLLLKEDSKEILLIAADRKGLFIGIPYYELPPHLKMNKNIQIPLTLLRLKSVRSYLALMYCDRKYANIMAISGSEPKTPETATSEAASLKLKGTGIPVFRDLEMERQEAKWKRFHEKTKDQESFIKLEDQLLAERSFTHDSSRDAFKYVDAY